MLYTSPGRGCCANAQNARTTSCAWIWSRTYSETNRIGDHICYYSDLSKLKTHFPGWSLQHSLDDILDEMIEGTAKTLGR